ncbi:hypothetical protein LTS10_000276 [Elasticomyces elasticus]|nr:hypothetical protein LTS10_000276 [Elasticomyces elasticus]
MDASFNDHSNVLRPNVLLDKLPLELREMIWTSLLVHQEPITAKLAQRIVLTNECEHGSACTRKAESHRRHVRQTHASPRFPALAFVCKDLAREIMIFYLKNNIFRFDVERGHFYQVNGWLENYEKRCESVIRSRYHETPFRAEDYLTLRFSFSFAASFGSTPKHWTVEYKLAGPPEQGPKCAIDVKPGALLLEESILRLSNGPAFNKDMAACTASEVLLLATDSLRRLHVTQKSVIDQPDRVANEVDPPPRASLLGLPFELREMIWSLVLIQADPITAKIGRRTIMRTRSLFKYSFAIEVMSPCTQRQAMPQSPPLALVARAIGNEVLAFYYKKHVFAFTIDKRNTYEVREWLDAVQKRCQILCSDIDLDAYLTIRIKFALPTSRPAVGLWAAASDDATIEYNLSKSEGGWVVRLGGALQSGCECWVAEVIENNEKEGIVSMADLTWRFEQRIGNFWLHRKRGEAFVECQKCGKLRYDREDVDSSDDESEDEL